MKYLFTIFTIILLSSESWSQIDPNPVSSRLRGVISPDFRVQNATPSFTLRDVDAASRDVIFKLQDNFLYIQEATAVNGTGLTLNLDTGDWGIGTATPNHILELKFNTVGDGLHLNNTSQTDQDSVIRFALESLVKWVMGADDSLDDAFRITFGTELEDANTFVIKTNGNVGINTDTPIFQLDVNGSGRIDGILQIGQTIGVTGDLNLMDLGVGLVTVNGNFRLFDPVNPIKISYLLNADILVEEIVDATSYRLIIEGLTPIIVDDNGDIHFDGPGFFAVNTNTLFVDSVNNRVGIGTTSPVQLLALYIDSTAAANILIEQDGTGDAHVDMLLTGINAWRFGIDNSDSDSFKFQPAQTADFSGTVLTIETGGNVGVGITNPVSLVHVYEDTALTSTSAGITVEQDGEGDALFQFLITGSRRWVTGVDKSDLNKYKIASTNDLDSDARLTIDIDGKVGIGTTSPAVDLEVSGDAGAAIRISDGDDAEFTTFTQESGATGSLVIERSDTEPNIEIKSDGNILLAPGALTRVGIGTTAPGATLTVVGDAIFNESGLQAADFRVESDTNPNIIFVDSAGNNVGIGTGSPLGRLHVVGGMFLTNIITIAVDDLSPDVSGGNTFVTSANTGATSLTDLDNAVPGQVLTLRGGSDTNSTVVPNSSPFILNSGGAFTLTLDDTLTLCVKANGDFVERSRSKK